jgi:hypothetical protein
MPRLPSSPLTFTVYTAGLPLLANVAELRQQAPRFYHYVMAGSRIAQLEFLHKALGNGDRRLQIDKAPSKKVRDHRTHM